MRITERGFSLVEVLIGFALLGVLAVAGMSLMKNNMKSQKTVEQNYEVTASLANIRALLSFPENCLQTLGGQSPSSGSVTRIKKKVGGGFENVYEVNVTHPGGLKVVSYSLDNSLPGLASNETYLKVIFSRGSSAMTDEITKFVKIHYTPNGAGTIQHCSSVVQAYAKLPFTTICRKRLPCHTQALSVCQAAMGPESCVQSVYCTQADAGDQDVPIVGYVCSAGLCTNGKRGIFHNLLNSNFDGGSLFPPGYTASGALNCNPGTAPYVP